LKNFFGILSKIILVLVVAALVWYNLPQTQDDPFSYLPDKALGYGQVKVNWSDKGPQELFNVFWQKMAAANPQLNNGLARHLALAWLPQEITAAVLYDRQYELRKQSPGLVTVIKLDKKTRLLKLVKPWIKVMSGWEIENNLVIISDQPDNAPRIRPEELITLKNMLLPQRNADLNFFFPNRDHQLTALVKSFEEKNKFSLFPSISMVDYLEIDGKLADANRFQGKITFVGKHISDVDNIGMDTIFLNSLLQRFLLGNDLDYTGEVSSLANYVEINYRLVNLNKIWDRFK